MINKQGTDAKQSLMHTAKPVTLVCGWLMRSMVLLLNAVHVTNRVVTMRSGGRMTKLRDVRQAEQQLPVAYLCIDID